jgi:hypothetical protein
MPVMIPVDLIVVMVAMILSRREDRPQVSSLLRRLRPRVTSIEIVLLPGVLSRGRGKREADSWRQLKSSPADARSAAARTAPANAQRESFRLQPTAILGLHFFRNGAVSAFSISIRRCWTQGLPRSCNPIPSRKRLENIPRSVKIMLWTTLGLTKTKTMRTTGGRCMTSSSA